MTSPALPDKIRDELEIGLRDQRPVYGLQRAADVLCLFLRHGDRSVVAQQLRLEYLLVGLDLVAQNLGGLTDRGLELAGQLGADASRFAGSLGRRAGNG